MILSGNEVLNFFQILSDLFYNFLVKMETAAIILPGPCFNHSSSFNPNQWETEERKFQSSLIGANSYRLLATLSKLKIKYNRMINALIP
jgi:hypothetical protein